MPESCGTCTLYSGSAGRDAMPGFGNCRDLPKWKYVSAWPWPCRFTPSRYDGPDKDPNPYQQMVEGGHTIGIVKDGKLIAVDAEVYVDPKDDRPPLELT